MMATDGPMKMAMRGRDSSANTKSGSVEISVHFDSTEDLQSFINQTSDYEVRLNLVCLTSGHEFFTLTSIQHTCN